MIWHAKLWWTKENKIITQVKNKIILGLIKDEAGGKIIAQYAATNLKTYGCKVQKNDC